MTCDDADLACPRCGTALEVLHCAGCGANWHRALGVPFLGDFEADDALGLIEIAANAPNRSALAIQPGTVERLDALCAAFHAAEDKVAFKEAHEEARAFYFENRYHEWVAVETLLEGHDLAGSDVLDIGAGPGFDARRLEMRGARVTALEFSPILAEAGQAAFPSIRWIGGFSHALPFCDGAFDYVFINAALHHMRDIPTAIAEALRVLRPGGLLITSGDPFRDDDAGPEREFEVFDRHEAVLLGINEQIPRLSDFLETLLHNRAILEPELFTQMLHGGRSGSEPDIATWTPWDFDRDSKLLRRRSGGLAMRVRLLAPWPHPRAIQSAGILPAATFAGWLDSPAEAVAKLARVMPPSVVDTPFPGAAAKMDLINGWRVARSTPTSRIGFSRARLFLRRNASVATLHYEIRAEAPGPFVFRVNAQDVGSLDVGRDWTDVAIDVSGVTPGESYLLEFARQDRVPDFDGNCFAVRLPGTFDPPGTPASVGGGDLIPDTASPTGLAGLWPSIRRRLGRLRRRFRERLAARE